MDKNFKSTSILIEGMTCSSCELKVENTLQKLEGVISAKVSLAKGRAEVVYDGTKINIMQIVDAINELDYKATIGDIDINTVKPQKNDGMKIDHLIGIGIIVFALYMIIKSTIGFNFIPEIDESMGYGVLFLVGALTSLHCIAMCGGINLSQCVGYANAAGDDRLSKLKPSFLYNLGRVISYTAIGGIVGGLGSVVSFSGSAKGLVAVLAGVFMIIMGINMLNIFPWLRRFNISMPKFIGQKLYSGKVNRGPFYVGLLNGFMPCGPLQSMQLYALGTGSIVAGAASMFFFSLGTVPLMFGLGAVSTILSKNFTNKLMKFSAALVIILGVGMISRGLSLSGINTVVASTNKGSVAKLENGVQTVAIDLESSSYAPIIVQKGIPVRFIINAEQDDLNGCNNPVVIQKYDIQRELVPGENVIEFTPEETGTIPYSCWMGMIRSSIKVVDDISQVKGSDVAELESTSSSGGGCSMGASGSTGFAFTAKTVVTDVYAAKTENGVQQVTVTVDENGFSPNAIVLQKNVKAIIKFEPKALNDDNYAVFFPEYQGGLDLSQGQLETPELEITESFGFVDAAGTQTGFIKVVEDMNNIDMEAVKIEAQNYSQSIGGGAGGGASCH